MDKLVCPECGSKRRGDVIYIGNATDVEYECGTIETTRMLFPSVECINRQIAALQKINAAWRGLEIILAYHEAGVFVVRTRHPESSWRAAKTGIEAQVAHIVTETCRRLRELEEIE